MTLFLIEAAVVLVLLIIVANYFYNLGLSEGASQGTEFTLSFLRKDGIIRYARDPQNNEIVILSGNYTEEDYFKNANVHFNQSEDKKDKRIDLVV